MRKSKKAAVGRKQKGPAGKRRVSRELESSAVEIIREFDRAEPTPPTKEIQLMTDEERNIFERPSTI
jgi:hypothetical protein